MLYSVIIHKINLKTLSYHKNSVVNFKNFLKKRSLTLQVSLFSFSII